MGEILLAIILVVFIIYHSWYVHEQGKKEKKYINAILAKGLPEMMQADLLEDKPDFVEDEPPEFVPVEDADDKTFQKMIRSAIDKSK